MSILKKATSQPGFKHYSARLKAFSNFEVLPLISLATD
ncbi:hypothetical protein MuYL_0992 [Mucilaginibacter xinganensis]|uniref:Uncharacterized protein n=1 Tax=Mucilaginibacter xinganensis TaxID=1234841 RepID=A0A223NSN5_9SPHI|nr:hypothetical protein MuYL_0992 [Mucilaginibacter xinganensis]